MQREFIDKGILVCPTCVKDKVTADRIRLSLYDEFRPEPDMEHDGDVKNGRLVCRACKRLYPILNGVAIFTSSSGSTRYTDSAFAQGYIQTHFRDVIAANAEARQYLEFHDVTGFYSLEPTNNYYGDLFDLVEKRISAQALALDFGCSVGRLAQELARKAEFVIGVDLSVTHIELARDLLLTRKAKVNLGQLRVSGSGLPGQEVWIDLEPVIRSNVEFIVADDKTLPFEDGAFDIICSASVIDRVPDAKVFLENLDRVAHDGTTLLLTTPFDQEEKSTPKEKWLGFGAFGTREGAAETALIELLKRHHYRRIDERNLPWVGFSDKRHHHVWSVYSGVFESVKPEIQQLDTQQALPDSLLEAYQRVFSESRVYQEVFSPEDAQQAFARLELLLVAKRCGDGKVIGFTGGQELGPQNGERYNRVYVQLKQAWGEPIFYINELGVLNEYEGGGLGGRLLDYLLGTARARGYHTFMLFTNFENDRALSLYRKRGFSFLADANGVVTLAFTQQRTTGEDKEDLRPCLYRVEDFSRIQLKDNSEVLLEFIHPIQLKLDGLLPIAQVISKVFKRAFGKDHDWPVEKIMHRLPKLSLAMLAFDTSSHEPIGYMMFDRASHNGNSILFLDSVGVTSVNEDESRNWQRSGVGTQMLKEGLRRLPHDIIITRTQNPAAVGLLRKAVVKPKDIAPLDVDYSPADSELLRSVKDQIAQLHNREVDLMTGICKRAYRGELGSQMATMKEDDMASFNNRMKQLDPSWDSKQGDAVVLIVRTTDSY